MLSRRDPSMYVGAPNSERSESHKPLNFRLQAFWGSCQEKADAVLMLLIRGSCTFESLSRTPRINTWNTFPLRRSAALQERLRERGSRVQKHILKNVESLTDMSFWGGRACECCQLIWGCKNMYSQEMRCLLDPCWHACTVWQGLGMKFATVSARAQWRMPTPASANPWGLQS